MLESWVEGCPIAAASWRIRFAPEQPLVARVAGAEVGDTSHALPLEQARVWRDIAAIGIIWHAAWLRVACSRQSDGNVQQCRAPFPHRGLYARQSRGQFGTGADLLGVSTTGTGDRGEVG